jgi:hypothetical protein
LILAIKKIEEKLVVKYLWKRGKYLWALKTSETSIGKVI